MKTTKLSICLLVLLCAACLGRQPGESIDPPDKPGSNWPTLSDPQLGNPVDPTPTPEPLTCTEALGVAPAGFPLAPFGVNVGQTLEDFPGCLVDSDGNERHLYEHLGEVVLISVGAGWCPPCKDEAPDIQQLFADYEADGFTVIMAMGEGWTSNSAPTDAFLEDWEDTYSLTFSAMADDAWSLSQYYKPGDSGYIPLNVIVDRDGIVLYNAVGGLPVGTARQKITDALAKPASLDY